jgi:hypothetical protein
LDKYADALEDILEMKKLRRKKLSELPFKKKIACLVRLQEMARGIKKSGRGQKGIIWKIEE